MFEVRLATSAEGFRVEVYSTTGQVSGNPESALIFGKQYPADTDWQSAISHAIWEVHDYAPSLAQETASLIRGAAVGVPESI